MRHVEKYTLIFNPGKKREEENYCSPSAERKINMTNKQIKYLSTVPTGYITDALCRFKLERWMDFIYPITTNRKIIFGRAVTVRFGPKRGAKNFSENLYSIIGKCGKENVLVIGALGTKSWVLGENIVHMALYQGISGIVIDGCVRDFAEISQMDIPVFCKGASVRPFSLQLELIDYQEPLICGGARVNPGDIIAGDSDGIVVIPSDYVSEIAKQVRDIEELEKLQEKIIAEKGEIA